MIESPVVSIHIPVPLRAYADGAEEVTVSGDNVGEALAALGNEHPAILQKLMDERGSLRPYMNIYLRGVNVVTLEGLETPLANEDVLTIISLNLEEMAASNNNFRTSGKEAGRAI